MPVKIPELILHNITPSTREFMLVFGAYNAAICRGFAQPVVGLSAQGWFPEYASMHPFAGMGRGEIVISRVPPVPCAGGTDCDPAASKAAASSANIDTNIRVLMSFLRSTWIRPRCILSNAGVARSAQERFESRNFPSQRAAYLKHFMELADVRIHQVAALCAPPKPVPNSLGEAPVIHHARQVCASPAHWDALPESEKARMLAEEQLEWQHKYSPAWGNSRRNSDIIVTAPEPTFDEITSCEGWKQPPNASERESIERDDWK